MTATSSDQFPGVSGGKKVIDRHMDAAQELMPDQFPHL